MYAPGSVSPSLHILKAAFVNAGQVFTCYYNPFVLSVCFLNPCKSLRQNQIFIIIVIMTYLELGMFYLGAKLVNGMTKKGTTVQLTAEGLHESV